MYFIHNVTIVYHFSVDKSSYPQCVRVSVDMWIIVFNYLNILKIFRCTESFQIMTVYTVYSVQFEQNFYCVEYSENESLYSLFCIN